MASDIKISELTVATTSNDTDILPIVQSNETKQVTRAILLQDLESDALGTITFTTSGDDLIATKTKVNGTVSTETIDLSGIAVTVDDALSPTSENPVQNKVINTALETKENVTNKVTSISSSSTDTQYPSAKCVYDIVGDLETILTTLDIGGGVNVNS